MTTEIPNLERDACRAYDVLLDGGYVLNGSDVGYGMSTGRYEALARLLAAKDRSPTKRTGLVTDYDTHLELFRFDKRARQMIDLIAVEFKLPIGIVGPVDMDHPAIRKLTPIEKEVSLYRGTMSSPLNFGGILAELARLNRENDYPLSLSGSSANMGGEGNVFRVEDVPAEIRGMADLTLDYGLSRYSVYGRATTAIDFDKMVVHRIGPLYEVIADLLLRYFDVALPPDPGREVNRLGHMVPPFDPLDVGWKDRAAGL
jgi:tRNA A37 threonylcarbamoyladenosine synthetase subunit TsaC/SUA5/YrdC